MNPHPRQTKESNNKTINRTVMHLPCTYRFISLVEKRNKKPSSKKRTNKGTRENKNIETTSRVQKVTQITSSTERGLIVLTIHIGHDVRGFAPFVVLQ
jgi:hypothetical protein